MTETYRKDYPACDDPPERGVMDQAREESTEQADPADLAGSETQSFIPDVEDCASGNVPALAPPQDGKRKIRLPVLTSMTKFLFKNYRLALYTFLNNERRIGRLAKTVGFMFTNKVINKDACKFTGVSYWRISREEFIAEVEVELTLQTRRGDRIWTGYLECWCSFYEKFSCAVENLTAEPEYSEDGYERLSPFLIPYYTNRRMDDFGERYWFDCGLPEALSDPNVRSAAELAKRKGLNIEFFPVYEHQGVSSIIFFKESDLAVGEDKVIKYDDGSQKTIRKLHTKKEPIPANTIVVNTNLVRRDYSAFNIYHECVHYELHYLFYRLQEMASNDVREIETTEVVLEEGEEYNDPIYFMEKQANRGAYALMMPENNMRQMVMEECSKVEKYRHLGEKYEIAGKAISKRLGLPHFRVRARMIQLGFIEAKGALNYADKKLIQPFAFNIDSWRTEQHTFVISRKTAEALYDSSEDFKVVIDSKRYIYADGHVVRNDPKYVTPGENGALLTPWANAHVDDCCLRFERQYIQKGVGEYILGRMFYDPHYVEQTRFFLTDIINQKNLDEIGAKIEYRKTFPCTFKEAFDYVMHQKKETRESTADKLNITRKTLYEWLNAPEKKVTIDFITIVSLTWELPDWISSLLLDRAAIRISEYDRRHQAIYHILHTLWDKGIDEANNYLKEMRCEPLKI